MKQCAFCESYITRKDQRGDYCSRQCHQKDRTRKATITRRRVCELCGKEFIMPHVGSAAMKGEYKAGRFCSRKCFGQWRSKQPKAVPHKYCNVYFRTCDTCGKVFTTKNPLKKYCDDKCSVKAHQQKRTPHRQKPMICQYCGHKFVPQYRDKRRSFCSDICAHKGRGDSRKPKERAEYYDVEYMYVNPSKVFVRDGWRCQLCGRKLSKKNRGTLRDDAPELDHIIPISRGGGHTYLNTQCACRKCNGEKGARERGQLRLFG